MKRNIKNNMLLKNRIAPKSAKLLLIMMLATLNINTNLQASTIELYSMSSGPISSMAIGDRIVTATPQSATILSNVPTSGWTYGCSNTAAGMIFGYYDRIGYSNMYR